MNKQRQGIYAAKAVDWFTFRRGFSLPCDATPDVIAKRLAALSQPHPMPPTPFHTSLSVAVAHTIHHTGLFEIHVVRGLPWGEHYSSLIVTGRLVQQAPPASDDDNPSPPGQTFITGQIHPAQRGMTIYSGVIILLMLWVAAATVSSLVSPMTNLVAALVAALTTTIVICVIYALLFADLVQLTQALRSIQ